MTSRKAVSVLFLGALWTVGCSNRFAAPRYQGFSYSLAGRPTLSIVDLPAAAQDRAVEPFVAVRHTLDIVASEAELQKDWESVIAFCATIRCQVTGSNLSSGAAAFGSVSLRVAPEDLPRLFGHLGKIGRIARHMMVTEDKTGDVIDADAKIKNLTSYRDSLRGLLNRSSAGLKDLVEIQRELSKVQSELDSEALKRQVLAKETEKVAVEIRFVTPAAASGWSFFDRVAGTLGNSAATLVLVVVAALPWLAVLAPAAWGVWKLLRRLRRKRAAPVPPPLRGQA